MLYSVGRSLFRFLFLVFCRWEVRGRENLPEEGPVIVFANHTSWWDPIAVCCALNRRVHFMAKKELFANRLLGAVLKRVGAFPVNRGVADRSALRTSLKLLQEGKIIGIFPEGSRSRSGELQDPLGGVAFIALKSGAPVCPIALQGTGEIFRKGLFQRVQVIIGKPFVLERQDKFELQDLAKDMMKKIQELIEFQNS